VSQSQMPLPSRSMLISTLVSLVTLNSDPMRETLAAHHKKKKASKHETYKTFISGYEGEQILYLMRFKKQAQFHTAAPQTDM
jgi:hypothetical protein